MKKNLLLIIFFALLGTSLRAQMNLAFQDTLQKALDARATQLNVKGVAAAVVFPDGSAWSGASGNHGSQPLGSDMLFEMGSNTKTYVAAIILQMQEEGKLDIEDTLYRFLNPIDKVPYGITLKQLLNHTSGIYSYTSHPDFATFINNNPSHKFNIDTIYAKYLNAPSFPAGSSWEYSNTNYLLLGQVIEAVDQKDFHLSLRDRMLKPLGLDETFLDEYENYTQERTGTWLTNGTYFTMQFTSFMSGAWAAGAILSTPEDLAQWAFELYGDKVLNAASMNAMRTTVNIAPNQGYGLGMFTRSYRGKAYHGHGGTTLQNSQMEYSMESDFSCVTVVNEQDRATASSIIQNMIIDIVERGLPFVGVEAVSDLPEFVLYPNPSESEIHVDFKGQSTQGFTGMVFNTSGQSIRSYETIDQQLTISKTDLGSGLFYLILTDSQGSAVLRETIVFR